MPYSTNRITSLEECNQIISVFQRERDDLAIDIVVDQRDLNSFSLTSEEVKARLEATRNELNALRAVLPAMVEGPGKNYNARRVKILESREVSLSQRTETSSVGDILEKEFELERDKWLVTEYDRLLAALNARKAELGG
jgi:hypothetical protein